MAPPKTKPPVKKPHQVVLRMSDESLRKIDDIITWSEFEANRTTVVTRGVDVLHEKMKKGQRK